jgi:hypothetical protein
MPQGIDDFTIILPELTDMAACEFTRNDQPVVDCAYGYQKEDQEEASEGADEKGG